MLFIYGCTCVIHIAYFYSKSPIVQAGEHLVFAEKIRVNTYIDVLGDPQSHSDAVIKEFEAL